MAKDRTMKLTRFGTGPKNFRRFLTEPIFDALEHTGRKEKVIVEEEVKKFCKEIGFPLNDPENKDFLSKLEQMYWEVGMDTFDIPKSVYDGLPKETVTIAVVIGDRLFQEVVTTKVYLDDPIYGKVALLTGRQYEKVCC